LRVIQSFGRNREEQMKNDHPLWRLGAAGVSWRHLAAPDWVRNNRDQG